MMIHCSNPPPYFHGYLGDKLVLEEFNEKKILPGNLWSQFEKVITKFDLAIQMTLELSLSIDWVNRSI